MRLPHVHVLTIPTLLLTLTIAPAGLAAEAGPADDALAAATDAAAHARDLASDPCLAWATCALLDEAVQRVTGLVACTNDDVCGVPHPDAVLCNRLGCNA